jgi:hypothetical protein
MKATLESRKSVRLNWLKLENIKFTRVRTAEWSYSLGNVAENQRNINVQMQFLFNSIMQPVPQTNIIIFEHDLPQSYTKTEGTIGDKFLTEKTADMDVKITDRIVKLEQGEEKITTKPVLPHETTQYKEIQIHERTDKILRKLTLKNESAQAVQKLELIFIENKEIRFLQSNPAPTVKDPPEYRWIVQIPPDGTITIELALESYSKITYKIERDKVKTANIALQRIQANIPSPEENDFDNNMESPK